MGKLDLKWTKLEGAKDYWIVFSDKQGKEIRRGKFLTANTSMVNLMPGEYQIEVFATDQFGREGQKGAPRQVVVPNNSGLKAPKLKKIKVN